MKHAFFFGYGSLVNRSTHGFSPVYPARIQGWRRAWVSVPGRNLCLLSAIADPKGEIEGLIAPVPNSDWAALDQREAAYERHHRPDQVTHGSDATDIAIYAVAPSRISPPGPDTPILLSYLDVVIQGYLTEYGHSGADRFFTSTQGWQAPILDDRAAPRYPRAQPLSPQLRALVDKWLDQLGSQRVSAED